MTTAAVGIAPQVVRPCFELDMNTTDVGVLLSRCCELRENASSKRTVSLGIWRLLQKSCHGLWGFALNRTWKQQVVRRRCSLSRCCDLWENASSTQTTAWGIWQRLQKSCHVLCGFASSQAWRQPSEWWCGVGISWIPLRISLLWIVGKHQQQVNNGVMVLLQVGHDDSLMIKPFAASFVCTSSTSSQLNTKHHRCWQEPGNTALAAAAAALPE